MRCAWPYMHRLAWRSAGPPKGLAWAAAAFYFSNTVRYGIPDLGLQIWIDTKCVPRACLGVHGGVPVAVEHDDGVRRLQVQPQPAGARGQQEAEGAGALRIEVLHAEVRRGRSQLTAVSDARMSTCACSSTRKARLLQDSTLAGKNQARQTASALQRAGPSW